MKFYFEANFGDGWFLPFDFDSDLDLEPILGDIDKIIEELKPDIIAPDTMISINTNIQMIEEKSLSSDPISAPTFKYAP